jgi:hypothetical protein
VVAKVMESLAISEEAAQNFDIERFNLRTLSELEFRKQYKLGSQKRFAALENSNDNEDIDRAWENVKENIKLQLKRF